MDNQELIKQQQAQIDNLKLENDYLKQQLLDTSRKLDNSEKFKSHFISNVTNELINPVTSLLNLSELIYKAQQNVEIDQMKKFAQFIHNEAIDLNFQLKNIFMSAVFESGNFEITAIRCSLMNIINSILNDFKYFIDKKQVEIVINKDFDDKEDEIFTDVDKLRLVFVNILNNALHYSNDDSKIIISLTIKNDTLKVSVRDFGVGLPVDFFDKVFERFYRLNNTINSVNKGSGLGLTVSKQIVELLGGEIHFTEQEQGTEIVFEINLGQNIGQKDLSIHGNDMFFDEGIELF